VIAVLEKLKNIINRKNCPLQKLAKKSEGKLLLKKIMKKIKTRNKLSCILTVEKTRRELK
jgi:hypothetical protein